MYRKTKSQIFGFFFKLRQKVISDILLYEIKILNDNIKIKKPYFDISKPKVIFLSGPLSFNTTDN